MSDRKLLNIELGRIKAERYRDLPPSGLVVVLDNIRSAHNVGSAFRTADAFKADKVFLCGICAVFPPDKLKMFRFPSVDIFICTPDITSFQCVRLSLNGFHRIKF